MKLRLLFPVLFVLFFHHAKGQYTTPNTGQTYELTDLISASNGVVSFDTGFYAINNDLTISANDTFLIDSAAQILMAPGVLITSLGHLNLNQSNGSSFIDFTPLVQGQSYKGIRIENDDNSILKNVIFIEAGGIRVLNADITIENCAFLFFDQSHSTGVINLFQSSPTISSCFFQNNQGPAFNSGANVFSAPKILNCYLEFNNESNSNSPQINLGPSGINDTIVIKGNEIRGNRNNTQVGGISTSNLIGAGFQNVVIDSNLIYDNRYGITCTGSNLNATITRNTILDNNSQNNPNLGGSGINFNGTSTNTARVGGNKISGNLWGITIQGTAVPNIGDSTVNNTGHNCFSNNQNQGTFYALYNNTAGPIKAQLNDWDDINPENVITHSVDIGSLGLVDFALPQIGLENIGIEIDYKILNDTIYFDNQVMGNINGYAWQMPRGERYFGLNPIHPIQQSGSINPFLINLIVRGECSSIDTFINVDLACGFTVNYPAFNISLDTSNKSITFSANISMDSSNSALSYIWDFGDGNGSFDSLGSHNYDSTGFFLLSLMVVNQCGDTLTFSDSVMIPSIAGFEELLPQPIKVFPNPFEDLIRLKVNQEARFEIADIQGLEVISGLVESGETSIDLSDLNNGIYYLRILYGDKSPGVYKLIKMK